MVKKVVISSLFLMKVLAGDQSTGVLTQEVLDFSAAEIACARAQAALLHIGLGYSNVDEEVASTVSQEASKALKKVEHEIEALIKKEGLPKKRLELLREVVGTLGKLVEKIRRRSVITKERKITDEEMVKAIDEAKKRLSSINHLSAIAQLKQEVDALCDALLMSTHKVESSYRTKNNSIERVKTICDRLEERISKKMPKGLREAVVLVEDLELDVHSNEKLADPYTYKRLQLLLDGLKKMLVYWFLATALEPDKKALIANDGLAEALTVIPHDKLTFVDFPEASNSLFFQVLKERVPVLCRTTWQGIAQAEGFDTSNMAGVQKQIKG